MNKEGTQKNWPKHTKNNDLHPRDDIQILCVRKEGGRRFASVDFKDASIQSL